MWPCAQGLPSTHCETSMMALAGPFHYVPLRCEKSPSPSDKAGAAPAATWAAIWPPKPSQPWPGAGVLHGMNLATRLFRFHYEFPAPGQHPRPLSGGLLYTFQARSKPHWGCSMKVPRGLPPGLHDLGVSSKKLGRLACSPEPSTASSILNHAEAGGPAETFRR